MYKFTLHKGKFNEKTIAGLIMFSGAILRFFYMLYTAPYERQHDVTLTWGHLNYIKYIAQNFTLPNTGQGQTYHPPLHHIICAIFYDTGKIMGLNDGAAVKLIQIGIMIMSCISLLYIYKIFKATKCNTIITLAGLAIFSFHPYNIYLSSFLNNDSTLMFFYILGFYYLLKWSNSNTIKNIIILSIFTTLAVITKKSAVMLIPIILMVFAVQLYKNMGNIKSYIKQFILFFCILIPLPAIVQLRSFVSFKQGFGYCLAPGLQKYENSIYNLFNFPVENLLKSPFTGDPFSEYERNRFFPEYVFKSSLFGEWRFPGHEFLGGLLVFAALGLLIVLAVYLLTMKKEDIFPYGYIFLLNLFIPIVLLFRFRLEFPYVCTQNFRYILPCLISAAYFIGCAANRIRSTRYIVIKYSVWGVVAAFCVLSGVFIISIGI